MMDQYKFQRAINEQKGSGVPSGVQGQYPGGVPMGMDFSTS